MTQKAPLVSIVMPTYNGEKYVEEQLASILGQTHSNLEVIVVDDVSKDRTLEIVRRVAEKDRRVRVYANPANLGLFANYLGGAARAAGDFVCVCDQDDYWREDRVEILLGLLEKDAANMLSYSDIEVTDAELKPLPSAPGLNETRLRGGNLKELSLLKNVTTHHMIRKRVNDLFVRASADAPFAHDHLMLVLAAGMGKVARSGEKLLQYRQHASNAIGAFYPTVLGKDRIVKELLEKVAYLRRPPFAGLDLDLGRLEEFCRVLRGGSFGERAAFMEYFTYLRNDNPKDRALGVLECLSPGLYAWLKRSRPANG